MPENNKPDSRHPGHAYIRNWPKPELSIEACVVECPRSERGSVILYLDVRDERTGVTFNNITAECEKGSWTVGYGQTAEVKWSPYDHPIAAMKTPCAPYAISCNRQEEFKEALIEQVKKWSLNLLLTTEYESRFVPDFKQSVLNEDLERKTYVG